MNRNYLYTLIIVSVAFLTISFKNCTKEQTYLSIYFDKLSHFKEEQLSLLNTIQKSNLNSNEDIQRIKVQIDQARIKLKGLDFWMRYLEPITYKKINGPLPVEWETEVFEKFEKPYKREGAGLTLASLYLEEENINKDSLLKLIDYSIKATEVYTADSISSSLKSYHHFFLSNRLFLLNLSAIYTTGFECPNTSRVIPELRSMLEEVNSIYQTYNDAFPLTPIPDNYTLLFHSLIDFTNKQSTNYSQFDHFTFIKDYVNPLYSINQTLINQYKVVSRSYVDFSLNKNSNSIFSKNLYNGQNSKGIFLRVNDTETLSEIDRIGKLLFYDPILSGNNLRSCASCHKPTEYFTDTINATPLQFDRQNILPRNSPSLINVPYHHLIMLDGKHNTLQHQTKAVIQNSIEMGSNEKEALQKVLSCNEYNKVFKQLLKYTPQEKEITLDHIASAITFYYSKFSSYSSPFDDAMNNNYALSSGTKEGFNLFMSKAQCATCHFVPQFNGVKPPYTNSEFEVLGVPENSSQSNLSDDKGRYLINEANETLNAFRTGSIRNSAHTMPYMHNGIFKNLNEVIDFYNNGGGAGRGIEVTNQTLSSDSLHLSELEKDKLIQFINSLNEEIQFEKPPVNLPNSKIKSLCNRKVGGEY